MAVASFLCVANQEILHSGPTLLSILNQFLPVPDHNFCCLLYIIDGDNESTESVLICQTCFVHTCTLPLFVTDHHFKYDVVYDSWTWA